MQDGSSFPAGGAGRGRCPAVARSAGAPGQRRRRTGRLATTTTTQAQLREKKMQACTIWANSQYGWGLRFPKKCTTSVRARRSTTISAHRFTAPRLSGFRTIHRAWWKQARFARSSGPAIRNGQPVGGRKPRRREQVAATKPASPKNRGRRSPPNAGAGDQRAEPDHSPLASLHEKTAPGWRRRRLAGMGPVAAAIVAVPDISRISLSLLGDRCYPSPERARFCPSGFRIHGNRVA